MTTKELVTLSREQIIERMESGDILRWIMDDVIDRVSPIPGMRYLFLGCDELCDDTTYEVASMDSDGIIEQINGKNDPCLIYDLC